MVQPEPEKARVFSDPNDFNSQVREYIRAKNSIDMMENRCKELRGKLFEMIDSNGEEDTNGNIVLPLSNAIDGVLSLEKQRRTTRKLNEEVAETIIESHGLGEELYEMKRVINEDALMAAYYNGKISEEELDEMFPVNVVWALRTLKR